MLKIAGKSHKFSKKNAKFLANYKKVGVVKTHVITYDSHARVLSLQSSAARTLGGTFVSQRLLDYDINAVLPVSSK